MQKKTFTLFLAAVMVVLGAVNTDTPAIINFIDGDVSLYRFQSDFNFARTGLGPAYVDGVNNVHAFFFPSGNAGLNTTANTSQSAQRWLYLDLTVPVPGTVPLGALFPFNGSTAGLITASLSHQTLRFDGANWVCCGTGLLNMTVGTTIYSRMGVTFPDPLGRALTWTIKWGTGVANPAYASNLVTTENPAGLWTIGTATGNDFAELDSQSVVHGKSGSPIVQGYFHVPFQFTIQQK
jgi:hypothetical protein